ncbi:hypothetical protein F4782DRAFT_347668 [Xylaria castorea]|nr:hypothetical protein F4782DRAFT_347668 [Xylaria castorea]
MFAVGCKDNTDSSCYCPDSDFVNNVFACLYAHGESDEVVSEAVSYFQGICAPFVPSNPGIATGAATITSVLTVTPTPAPSASYTTIQVVATTVVPCTDSVGEVIPSSSSTVIVSTAMTVPQVIFTTLHHLTLSWFPSYHTDLLNPSHRNRRRLACRCWLGLPWHDGHGRRCLIQRDPGLGPTRAQKERTHRLILTILTK